jgi:hypothetical protein
MMWDSSVHEWACSEVTWTGFVDFLAINCTSKVMCCCCVCQPSFLFRFLTAPVSFTALYTGTFDVFPLLLAGSLLQN